MIRYTVTTAKPSGKEWHGPGHARSAAGLARYHEANSIGGVQLAAASGAKWIDNDYMTTRDGVIVCNHSFGAMDKERFRADGVPKKPIDQLTWAQVKKLQAPDGTRIQRIETMMAAYARYGIGVALELKGDAREGFRLITPANLDRIVELANQHGVRLYIKASPERAKLLHGLTLARQRGVWTRATGTTTWQRPEVAPKPAPKETGMLLTNLVDVCRKAGLKVVEQNGWRSRGHGRFTSVETIICHHTAGPASGNMPSLRVVTSGRAGLAGPLCNLGLGRDGTVYVVAAGVAWHAGKVRRREYDNWHAIGIEAEATGTSSWPKVQMDAYARLCRALCDAYDVPVSRVLGHKEVCDPPGRKIDPNFDMDKFRAAVRAADTEEDDMANLSKENLQQIADAVWERKIEKLGGPWGKTRSADDVAMTVYNMTVPGKWRDQLLPAADDLADAVAAKLGGSADAAAVKQAVKDAIRELVED